MNLPIQVLEAIAEDRCVVFVGSRFASETADAAGVPYPSAKELAKTLGWNRPRALPGTAPRPLTPSVLDGATAYADAHGRDALVATLRTQVGAIDLEPTSAHRFIVERFPRVFTTCYDELFQRAAADVGQTLPVFERGEAIPGADEKALYRFRGGLDTPAQAMLTRADYAASPFGDDLRKQFRTLVRANVLFFIGYRPDEEEFEVLFEELSHCYGGELPRCHLAVAQGRIDDYQWQRWVWRGLLLFTADPSECADALSERLSDD